MMKVGELAAKVEKIASKKDAKVEKIASKKKLPGLRRLHPKAL